MQFKRRTHFNEYSEKVTNRQETRRERERLKISEVIFNQPWMTSLLGRKRPLSTHFCPVKYPVSKTSLKADGVGGGKKKMQQMERLKMREIDKMFDIRRLTVRQKIQPKERKYVQSKKVYKYSFYFIKMVWKIITVSRC